MRMEPKENASNFAFVSEFGQPAQGERESVQPALLTVHIDATQMAPVHLRLLVMFSST